MDRGVHPQGGGLPLACVCMCARMMRGCASACARDEIVCGCGFLRAGRVGGYRVTDTNGLENILNVCVGPIINVMQTNFTRKPDLI